MKPSILDTDILSEFMRGNPKVIAKVRVSKFTKYPIFLTPAKTLPIFR